MTHVHVIHYSEIRGSQFLQRGMDDLRPLIPPGTEPRT